MYTTFGNPELKYGRKNLDAFKQTTRKNLSVLHLRAFVMKKVLLLAI